MKIFVTGATGFLGSYVARLLVNKGHEVHALRRQTSSTELLGHAAKQIVWYESALEEVMTLESELKGIEVFIHCAALVSFLPRDQEKQTRVNVIGTQELVNLALATSVRKLIYISSIAALGKSTGKSLITEETHFESGSDATHYGLTKHLGEMEVWRGQAEGLEVVVLNPALILGAGKWTMGTPALYAAVWRGNPFYPKGMTGVVDVRDVASAVLMTMENEVSGERFILSSANMTYREILGYISKSINKRPPLIPLNGLLRAILWRAAALYALITAGKPLVSKESLTASHGTSKFDNSKLQQYLPFRYTDIKQTITETGRVYLECRKSGHSVALLPFEDKENDA